MAQYEEILNTVRQLIEVLIGAQAAELARQGQLKQAEAFLYPLTQQREVSPFIIDLLARILAQQNRIDEAKMLWQRALMMQPDNEAFQKAIARCDQIKRFQLRLSFWRMTLMSFIVAWFILTVIIIFNNLNLEQQLTELRQSTFSQFIKPGTSFPQISSSSQIQPMLQQYTNTIATALHNDPVLHKFNIVVEQDGPIVRIIGEVPNLWLRFYVERLARKVAPKAIIDLNKLRLPEYYEVREEDNLWRIAQRVYGNPLQWRELADANGLKYPYYIRPKQRLRLPQ